MEPTKAILTIEKLDPSPIDFVMLEMDQCFMDHHRVRVVLDLKKMGENVLSAPMQKSSLINEKIQIDLQVGSDAGNAYGFIGIITDVQIELDAGDHGLLHIFAASPTIELERGRTLQTFSDTTLSGIFDEVTQSVRFLNLTNKPKFSGPVKFSMQYKETDFQYLRRLAWMYGEKFFFSGDSLVFGDPAEKDTVKIIYDLELKEVKIGTRLISNTFQQYYLDDNNKKSPFEFPLKEPGTFAGEAGLQSDKLNLRKKPDMPMDVPTYDDGTLQYITEMRKKRRMTEMFYVTGRTKLYKVRIGGLLEIDFHGKMVVNDNLGTLRVIKVRHVLDEVGHYYNEFEAVPSKFGYIPSPDVAFPVAQAIPATVVANEDPDGVSKIQVQFDFETKTCNHWFPIMTPQGGGNADIGEERNVGFIFIPEIKDKVLVSFFDGNPDLPFVMGGMYHGANADNQGGGPKNYIKTIITKSGHTIRLDDTKGKEKIQVFDYKGNIVEIDTPDDTINIRANSTINLTAVNINLLAKNAITANAGVMFEASAGVTSSLTGGVSTFINAGKEAAIKAGKTLSAKGGKNALISSGVNSQMTLDNKGNVAVKGKKKVDISSKDKVLITGTKQTLVKGQKTKVQGTSRTDIKGKQVHVG